MRKILFVFILMSFSTLVSAQYYNHFPDSNAVWSMRRAKFSVKGDTLLSGKTYKKYYVQWDSVNFNFDFAKAKYYAGVREDSSRIYAWHRLDTTERLLYDFNVNNLDTVQTWIFPFDYIPGAPINFYTNKYIVNMVSYYALGGVFLTNSVELRDDEWGTPTVWYAGIGSSLGPFITGMIDHYDFNYLLEKPMLCFQKDTLTAHFNTTYPIFSDSCFSYTYNVEENWYANQLFSVFPNPNNGAFNIKIQNSNKEDFSIEIFTINGQAVYKNQLHKSSLTSETIDLSTCSKGVYVVKVQTEDRIKVEKIVIN
ncbi:MAG TPA: T9SS type A sorting domain-containing protein [Bacteroidales bacterium]|nr:T9SS type A sorting domain-containing protein [Bacteroidales bacterium]